MLFFEITRSNIEGRLEPEFYRPSIVDLEKTIREKSFHKLQDYALSISGGATPKKTEGDRYYTKEETGVPFLRVQNLNTDGTLSLDDCLYINQETHDGMLSRSQVSGGDLLIKITGVGRMAIASVAPEGFIGNINQHMVVVKTRTKEISKYLAKYLNLDIIEKLASRHSTGGTRPALDYPTIKNIPIIEGIDFSPIEKAIKVKQQKEAEAQQLLDSIDAYLLNELSITIPEIKTDLNNRIFRVNRSEIEDRLDPFYIKHLNFDIKSTKYEKKRLGDISILVKGNSLTSKEIEQGTIPVIAGGQSIPYYHNISNFRGNIITVSSSGAYAGYVWYHNYPIYATDCTVVFSNNEKYVTTQYIFEIMKLQQDKIYKFQSGAAQPHVYPDNLRRISIPVPPLPKQQEIVNYIYAIRQQAKQLQEEGKAILENAKKEVEQMIIG